MSQPTTERRRREARAVSRAAERQDRTNRIRQQHLDHAHVVRLLRAIDHGPTETVEPDDSYMIAVKAAESFIRRYGRDAASFYVRMWVPATETAA